MQKSIVKTTSSKQTHNVGASFGASLLRLPDSRKHALVVALRGELGAGKTTFVQGVAKGLGVEEKILSPTFVIMKEYKVADDHKLYHIDCYRLKDEKDLLELGWKEIVSDPKNIILLEWPERVETLLPKSTIHIESQSLSETTRQITIPS